MWPVDVVIKKKHEMKYINENFRLIDVEEDQKHILAAIECKNIRSKKQSTYRNQMMRAYGELGDIRNVHCDKFPVHERRHSKNSEQFSCCFLHNWEYRKALHLRQKILVCKAVSSLKTCRTMDLTLIFYSSKQTSAY